MTPILRTSIPVLVAARQYLVDNLDDRDVDLHIGVKPPAGTPDSYALLSQSGRNFPNPFLADTLIRVRVFDKRAEVVETNADLLHGLMMAATHTHITTTDGGLWVSGVRSQMGPTDLSDPDVPLFGSHFAVFWSTGLHSA